MEKEKFQEKAVISLKEDNVFFADWYKYSEYLYNISNSLSKEQVFYIAKTHSRFDVTNEKIADALDTTPEKFLEQKPPIDLQNISKEVQNQLPGKIVPGTIFIKIGEVSYGIKAEFNGYDIDIYCELRVGNGNTVAKESKILVRKEYIKTVDKEDILWNHSKKVIENKIYPSFNDFVEHSQYTKNKIDDEKCDERFGPIYEEVYEEV